MRRLPASRKSLRSPRSDHRHVDLGRERRATHAHNAGDHATMKPESTIKQAIRHMLVNEYNAYYFAPVQMGMGVATLDLLCCIKGRFVGIEVKVPGKKPTVRQEHTIAAIIKAGGVAFWTARLE